MTSLLSNPQIPASPTQHQAIHRYPTRRPAELEAPPVDQAEYTAYRTATDLREPYRVPLTYLRNTKKFVGHELPEAPLIVFINSRSGGRAGPALTETLFHALGHSQVYDLREFSPGPVLQKIYANLAAAIENGDKMASVVRSRLRILAAGGDGTVAWVLKTVRELQLEPPPAVAVMPLGTGNDLSLSFGWGNTFLHKWIADYKTLYATMKRIADAEPRDLDTWNIGITAGAKSLFKQLPHSLALVGDLQSQSSRKAKVEGLFYNYFSVGLDARAAYGFHHLRETRPWAAPSRLINQAWYAYFSCASGWFCCAPPLNTTATLKVKGLDGTWQSVRIPSSVKAIVLLNLQSYGGGRDIWGLADSSKDTRRGWKTPIFNDGMFEAVGLHSGYHTAIVMGGLYYKVHGMRLAQTSEMLLELKAGGLHKGAAPVTHMQLDGEPWQQELPYEEGSPPMHIHVSPSGTSNMLFNTEKLQGMPKKIKALARREAEVSLVQQLSVGTPTSGSNPNPTDYPTLGSAKGATPRTPITVALPTTRQADSPTRNHRRMESGNPAVPVAQSTSGTPTQAGRVADDSTEQALSLGRPSTPTHRLSSTPGSSAQPPPTGQAQRHLTPTDVPNISGLSTSAATQMHQDSHTGIADTPTGLLPANQAAAPLGTAQHGQQAGVSGCRRGAEAKPQSGEMQSRSTVGSLQDSSVHSPSQQQQTSDRLAQLQIPPLLDPSDAGLPGRGFSSQAIGLQSAQAAPTNAADNNQQSVASQDSTGQMAESAVPFPGSLRQAAMQKSDVSTAPETMQGSDMQSISQVPDTQLLTAQSSAGTGDFYVKQAIGGRAGPLDAYAEQPHIQLKQSGERSVATSPPSAS
ncbi:hypothetical protein WJX77_006239 [Trebouxia sp. C0004]